VINFSLDIFRWELSQISPTLRGIISSTALQQDFFIVFGRALPKHGFVGKARHSPLSCVL